VITLRHEFVSTRAAEADLDDDLALGIEAHTLDLDTVSCRRHGAAKHGDDPVLRQISGSHLVGQVGIG
jgi:hypothetical protein